MELRWLVFPNVITQYNIGFLNSGRYTFQLGIFTQTYLNNNQWRRKRPAVDVICLVFIPDKKKLSHMTLSLLLNSS